MKTFGRTCRPQQCCKCICAATSLVNFFMNCCGVRSKGVAPQRQSKTIIITQKLPMHYKTIKENLKQKLLFWNLSFRSLALLSCITCLIVFPDSVCFHLLEKYASSTHLSPTNMQWTWEKIDFADGLSVLMCHLHSRGKVSQRNECFSRNPVLSLISGNLDQALTPCHRVVYWPPWQLQPRW